MNKLRADFGTGMLGAFGGLFTFAVFLLVDRVVVYYDYMARMMETERVLRGLRRGFAVDALLLLARAAVRPVELPRPQVLRAPRRFNLPALAA